MRTFKTINKSGKCILCNTNKDGEVTLIPIDGTASDGNEEAKQCHVDCINLRYNKETGILYQKV